MDVLQDFIDTLDHFKEQIKEEAFDTKDKKTEEMLLVIATEMNFHIRLARRLQNGSSVSETN